MNIETVSRYYANQFLDIEDTLKTVQGMHSTFFHRETCTNRLIQDYKTHGRLIVAYDFDDTVAPSKPEYNCIPVVKLLQICSLFDDIKMICFTARSTEPMIEEVKKTLTSMKIRFDTINDNLPIIKEELEITCPSKVLYSIFLDDRAGLIESYYQLLEFINWYIKQPKK